MRHSLQTFLYRRFSAEQYYTANVNLITFQTYLLQFLNSLYVRSSAYFCLSH